MNFFENLMSVTNGSPINLISVILGIIVLTVIIIYKIYRAIQTIKENGMKDGSKKIEKSAISFVLGLGIGIILISSIFGLCFVGYAIYLTIFGNPFL